MIAQAETYIYRETGDIPVQHSFPIDIGGFSSLTCTISITIKPRSFWKTVVHHLKQGDQFVYIHVLLFNYFDGKKKYPILMDFWDLYSKICGCKFYFLKNSQNIKLILQKCLLATV